MKQSARWTLTVSADVDRRVRRHLEKLGRKGDLALFVEEAVRMRLLQQSLKSVPTYSKPSANDMQAPLPPCEDLQGDGSYGG